MSHTHPISQPPEPLTFTSSRPPPPIDRAETEEAARRLRAELAASAAPARRSRLLAEIAELEERGGDDAAAARDYLAAYNADVCSKEPLEALVRLLEKRRSLRNLGRIVDALERAATAPDERVRALLMRAAYEADVKGDLISAKSTARAATAVEAAPAAEEASAWLALEVLAGRTADAPSREAALTERLRFASSAEWRALLLVDRAQLAVAVGDVGGTLSFLRRAQSFESRASWMATSLLERVLSRLPEPENADDARDNRASHGQALVAVADHLEEALRDPSRGDALGVPSWARDPARLVDAWLRAAEAQRSMGQLDGAAATLDRALAFASRRQTEDGPIAVVAVTNARMRIAEYTGDTALVAKLARNLLVTEKDPGVAAALALHIAEHCAAAGDRSGAFEGVSRALARDPASLPATALQLDMLAEGEDPAAFAAQLEVFAQSLTAEESRVRALLLAAYVWAIPAGDTRAAKAALGRAPTHATGQTMLASPTTITRAERFLAGLAGDSVWYEDATARLAPLCGDDAEAVSLSVELIRIREARGDRVGATNAREMMTGTRWGAWLGGALAAFLPPVSPSANATEDRVHGAEEVRSRAVNDLAAAEIDPEMARGLSIVAALRARTAGALAEARSGLRSLHDADASDPLVATLLAQFDRAAGDCRAAAATCLRTAAASHDSTFAASLRLEAGFELWRLGEHGAALEEFEGAIAGAPEAARTVVRWAAWAVAGDSLEGRRRALAYSSGSSAHGNGPEADSLGIERFAIEACGGDAGEAAAALDVAETATNDELGAAAALGRLVWPSGVLNASAWRKAVERIAARGPEALALAASEQTRSARESGDAEELVAAAARWYAAGGKLPSALEWLAAATQLDRASEEKRAWLAVADSLTGEARESVLVAAALLERRVASTAPAPLTVGSSPAARLANLELGPPGCDPRRRATVLSEVDGTLGEGAGDDAKALAAWSFLASGDPLAAGALFESAALVRPDDLAAWEGLRTCAEIAGDHIMRARAAAELGARCHDDERGAAFWEEAAFAWMAVHESSGDTAADANIDRALEASFARDARRSIAFDKLFRRVRARKHNDQLLALIARRLAATDEPQEIQKLFWEQARVLREKGDQDGALKALEHVTLLDADHVGALALIGEINIRRGNFDEAAASLARLAALDGAPPKSRVTAGVAAVDVYEKKLERHDKALEVLLALHAANLSTLPVRERLARAAARTGDWESATAALEELMYERPDAGGRVEAARLAMAIHRDRLGRPQGAIRAMTKLLGEVPADGEALELLFQTEQPPEVRRALLEKARRALVTLLQDQPTERSAVRRLVDVTAALGDHALHGAALSVLVALDVTVAQSEPAFVEITARNRLVPHIEMSDPLLRAIAAPGDEGPLADLFVVLGPTLTEALGPTLQSIGVGRRDRVDPRSGLALRNEIAAWAGAFRLGAFDLYVGGKDVHGVQAVPGDPPALVVGANANAPLDPLARARVARELLSIVRGTAIVQSRDPVTVAAVVAAACKLAGVPLDHPPYAVLAEVERLLGKAMSRKTRKLLPDICRAIAASRADAGAWRSHALASLDRMSVLACGDATVVLSEILDTPVVGLADVVLGSERAERLLRFVLSEEYLSLRRALNLEVEGVS
ncbi:MAG: hypothetical protein M3O50_17270 [Myxococcota bacterium]|nr:hypothetical protein [Myxococcota bacterium]